jgi:hypothetical protein
MEQSLVQAQVASAVPGRVRVRVSEPDRGALPRLQAHLSRQPGIHQVTVNHATGSVLIHCDHDRITAGDLMAMCYDVGVIVGGLVGGESDLPELVLNGSGKDLVEAIDDLDRRLGAGSRWRVALELVVPLIVGAIGVRQLVVYGLGQASGYLLLWVAFSTLIKGLRDLRATSPSGKKPTMARLAVAGDARGA